jgi:hypothetical protein
MKRAVCIIILMSMVLHCASRLGVLSFLYGKRHNIAFSVGLIAEIPIALCDGDYFSKQAPLIIVDHDTTDKQLPVQFAHAKEIILFVQELVNASISHSSEINPRHSTDILEVDYNPPLLSIFHPPCVIA